jgi:hypothetical protein
MEFLSLSLSFCFSFGDTSLYQLPMSLSMVVNLRLDANKKDHVSSLPATVTPIMTQIGLLSNF